MKRILILGGMVLTLALAFGICSGVTVSLCFGAEAIGVDTHPVGGGTTEIRDKGARSPSQNVVGSDKAHGSLSRPTTKDTWWRETGFETYGLHGDYQRDVR